MWKLTRFWASLALLLVGVSGVAQADVNAVLQWLKGTQQANGSFGAPLGVGTPYQATAEAMRTLGASGAGSAAGALQYLSAEPYPNTENLSRRVLVDASQNLDPSALVSALLSDQDSSGGFTELPGYQTTVLDTAFALDALSSANAQVPSTVSAAIGFLSQQQGTDGSWSDGGNGASVRLSALAVISLQDFSAAYPVTNAIKNGSTYLLSMRGSDGLWGRDDDSAQCLLALLASLADASTLQTGLANLAAHQLSDGSWSDDAYTTALVLRALAAAQARGLSLAGGSGIGSVQGTITLAGSSQPLAGVTVSAAQAPGASAQTNADGYFFLSGLPAGNQTLSANKSGFGTVSTVVSVTPGATVAAGNFAMAPSAQTGTLDIHLLDNSSGSALAATAVNITGPSTNFSGTTDASGNLELDGLVAGSYSVSLVAAGHTTVQGSVTVTAGQILSLNQSLQASATGNGSGASSVSGTVVDAQSGTTIAGVAVTLGGNASTSTSASGGFALGNLSAGSYTATLSATGYASRQIAFFIAAGSSTSVGSVPLYRSAATTTPTSVTLVGAVIDGLSNAPIAGASIAVGSLTAISDSLGHFSIAGIQGLTFSVQVSASGHVGTTYAISAPGFGDVAATFPLPPTPQPGQADALVVNVTSAANGQPVTGAIVTVVSSGLSGPTNANGSYTIQNPPSNFSLQVSALNFATRTLPMNLDFSNPSTYTLSVQLTPATSGGQFQVVSVTATGSGGGANQNQVFSAEVGNLSANPASALLIGRVLDASGNLVAKVLPYAPGTQTPQSSFSFQPNQTVSVQVPWNPGQLSPGAYTLELDVVQTGTITAKVPTGTILASATAATSVSPTQAVIGAIAFNPPLAQAGSSTPVALDVLISNSGNVALTGQVFNLSISQPGGSVVQSAQANLPALAVGAFQYVSFGNWVPAASGNLSVSVASADGSVQGQIAGNFYVGDKPAGTFTVTPQDVFVGTQTVQGSVSVSGVNQAVNASSPLLTAIDNAIQLGAQYVATNALADQRSTRCLRCHVQSESYYGLASLLNHSVGSDPTSTADLYNAISSAQESTGTYINGEYQYPVTETTLNLWALTQSADKLGTFASEYKAAKFLLSSVSNYQGSLYWASDYPGGWWNSTDAMDMLAITGIVDVLQTAKSNNVSSLQDYSLVHQKPFNDIDAAGLSPGPDGNLYTISYSQQAIVRFNFGSGATEYIVGWLGGGGGCNGLLALAANEFLVSCPGQILHVLPGGALQTVATRGNSKIPTGFARDASGMVYFSDPANNQILRGPVGGPYTTFASGGLLITPAGLAFGADGSLFVANYGNFNILKLDANGNATVFADTLAFPPQMLAVQADGSLVAGNSDYTDATSNQDFYSGLTLVSPQGVARRIVDLQALVGLTPFSNQVWLTDNSGNLYTLGSQPLDLGALPALQSLVNSVVGTTLANVSNGHNIFQPILLGEARKVITDPAMLAQINQAMSALNADMRSRQNTDGGFWFSKSGTPSDAMATALVGLGLEYSSPSANDPVVSNAVSFLLNSQMTNAVDLKGCSTFAAGAWCSADGVMATNFAPTGLVMAYLPKVLDRLGGLNVGVTLTFPANVSLSNPSLPPASDLTNADGTSTYSWQFPGLTGAGQQLGFDLTLTNLLAKETRAVATAAYAQSANSFDGSAVQVNLGIPSVTATDGLVLGAVSTDQDTYSASAVAQLGAQIDNVAPAAQSGSVVFTIKASDGSTVATLPAVQFGNIAGSQTQNISALWPVGNTLAGTYSAVVDVYDASGVEADEKFASFSISGAPATGGTGNNGGAGASGNGISLRVTTDKQTYGIGDTVNLSDLIDVSSSNALVAGSSLQLSITGPGGATVWTATVALGQLSPGYQKTLGNSDRLNGAAPGQYSVSATVVDGSGNTLVSAAASFAVAQNPAANLSGTEVLSTTSLFAGDPLSCTDTVSNSGAQALTAIPLQQVVVDLDTGATDQSGSQSVSLAAGASQSYQRSISTSALATGHHACLIQAQIAGSWQTLASAVFQVKAPDIRLNATLSVQSTSLVQGATQVCTATVNDVGTENGNGIAVKELVLDTDSGTIDSTTQVSVSIPAGGNQQLVNSFPTQPLAVGNHACQIQAQVGGSWQVLATTPFSVTAPAATMNLGAQLALSGRPKVLALMDAPTTVTGMTGSGCIANHRIELRGPWHQNGVPADATAVVTVNDDQGNVVDTETVSLASFNGSSDQNPGSHGVNLIVTGFTTSAIEVALVPTNGTYTFPAPRYQFVATGYENTYLQQINSGVVFPDCSTQTTNGGTEYQDFYVVPGVPSTTTDDSDPNGPAGSPHLGTQTSYLKSLLSANGWNLTVDNNVTQFADDLHSGQYGVVALFNESTALSTELQKELREYVYGGGGLIVAGGGEGLQFASLAPAVGITYNGVSSGATGLTVAAGTFYAGGASASLAYADSVFSVGLAGANTLATYSGTQIPALTQAAYGSGVADFAGYDVLLEAAHAGNGSVPAQVLLNLLGAVAPSVSNPPLAGTTLPLTAQIQNQGNAVSGQLLFSLPNSVSLVDPGSGSSFDSHGNVLWPFTLANGASTADTIWLRLPSGSSSLSAQVTASAAGGSSQLAASPTLNVSANQEHGIADALNWMSGRGDYTATAQALLYAQQDLNNNDATDALPELTAAADALIALNPATDPDAAWLRGWVDQALYQAEILAPISASVSPAPPPGAPGNLGATASSSSQINLNWSASNSTTAGITYNVYESTNAAFTAGASNLVASGIAGTTASISSLSAGTTYYFYVQAVDINGNSASSNLASATTQGAQSGGTSCHVSYTVNSDWGSGFNVGITINNTGSTALSSWTLTWTWSGNQQISGAWNGNESQSGAAVTITNASWNGSIAAGGNVSGIGFNGSYSGSNAAPTAFRLNGALCQ